MPVRIIAAHAKITFFVVGIPVILTAGWSMGIAVGGAIGITLSSVLAVALLVVAGRTFRGAGEPILPPRAWWRLTAGPVAGFVVAVLFALSGIGSAISGVGSDGSAALTVWVVVFDFAVAAAYANSSTRLLSSAA
ncbi:hypothetical protein [Leifsonia sp. EB34]|uniref:hypothetical protein n=1 Tax=Leifsonia sp. EB34 TaxID=3156303 RepID=UPI00351223C1